MISCPICRRCILRDCRHISATGGPGQYDWNITSSWDPVRGVILTSEGELLEVQADKFPYTTRTVPEDEADEVVKYHVGLMGLKEVLES